ncbi:DUF421 domain-containing protein [Comamonadaceae bacterium OTU4NAUVB1]|jgi:uncharacterized membrane protein YcaP (DUF421 family)|nr:DUF421 domain-containing protein [Comamonadaceae bacterium OTU4NAUVB1]
MDFDFATVLLNDLDGPFVVEIVFRTVVMFIVILSFLRLSGKKGVRQLSIFEVAIVIGLGSAAGDPMFNRDLGIVPALLVFACILVFYRGIMWISARSERFESLLEGDPVYVIADGEFVLSGTQQRLYAKDEFFSEMRQQSIEHVGQVRIAILETTGSMSFYYFRDDDVKPGLPVTPEPYRKKRCVLEAAGAFACTECARVSRIATATHTCGRCGHNEWVEAMTTRRIG